MTSPSILERDAARDRADEGTTGSPRQPRPEGLWISDAEERGFEVLGEQVTGPGLYSLWFMHTFDPAYATTDLGENHVDAVWFGGDDMYTVGYFVLPKSERPPLLAEIVRDLREELDLPAADLAAMFGVRRRQLYNLLRGEATSPPREEAIRALHDIVFRLEGILSGDRQRLRAAVLLPVGPRGETIYSAAASQDVGALRDVGRIVVDRLASGDRRGLVRRPSPRLARFGSAGAAREFLAEHRDETEDDR
jgi:transcriptional regulator with XRE-family HTH domain